MSNPITIDTSEQATANQDTRSPTPIEQDRAIRQATATLRRLQDAHLRCNVQRTFENIRRLLDLEEGR